MGVAEIAQESTTNSTRFTWVSINISIRAFAGVSDWEVNTFSNSRAVVKSKSTFVNVTDVETDSVLIESTAKTKFALSDIYESSVTLTFSLLFKIDTSRVGRTEVDITTIIENTNAARNGALRCSISETRQTFALVEMIQIDTSGIFRTFVILVTFTFVVSSVG